MLSNMMSNVRTNGPAFLLRMSCARSFSFATSDPPQLHREHLKRRGRAVGRRGALRHLLPEELQPGVDLPDELGVADAAKHDALEAHTLGAFELDRVALRRHEPSPGDLDRSIRLRRIDRISDVQPA